MSKAGSAVLILAAGLWTASPAPLALAEDAPAVQAGPEVEYAFGTVKKADAGSLVVNEFDYDTGEEKEVAYQLDPKVEISGAPSAAGIAPGDEVDVDYLVRQDQRVAVSLVVAKPSPAGEGDGEGE